MYYQVDSHRPSKRTEPHIYTFQQSFLPQTAKRFAKYVFLLTMIWYLYIHIYIYLYCTELRSPSIKTFRRPTTEDPSVTTGIFSRERLLIRSTRPRYRRPSTGQRINHCCFCRAAVRTRRVFPYSYPPGCRFTHDTAHGAGKRTRDRFRAVCRTSRGGLHKK